MHKIMYMRSLVPRPRPKSGRGLGGYELIDYARSTQCVAVNCEVPVTIVTLYCVCIRAEKACLWICTFWILFEELLFVILKILLINKSGNPREIQKSTLNLKSRNPREIQKSNLKSEIHVKSSGFRNLVRRDAPWRTPRFTLLLQ